MVAETPYSFGVTEELATRFRQVLGSSTKISSQPGLVAALMSTNATREQIHSIGGFVDGLELAKQVRLARTAGTVVPLSDRDKALLGIIKEPYADVDSVTVQKAQVDALRAAATQAAAAPDTSTHGVGGWIAKKLHQSSSFVFGLPVVKQSAAGMNRVADIAMTPYRMASTVGLDFSFRNPFTGTYSGLSDDTLNRTGEQRSNAAAAGYDPNSNSSMLAYYSRGEGVYHGMDDLRNEYGADQVAAAQAYIEHPDRFMDPNQDADTLAANLTAANTPTFERLTHLVDARHSSPGRDLAGAVGADPGSKTYTLLSGTTDGLVSWYADPFLIAGKFAKENKVASRGVASMTDTAGIERVMTKNAAIKRGWTELLDDATIIRRSKDHAEVGAAMSRIRARTPELAPLVDEINGARVVAHVDSRVPKLVQGAPITSYEDLVIHVTGTAALTRLANGMAAKEAILMPGAVSKFAYRRLKSEVAGALTARALADVSKEPWRLIASEDNAVDMTGAVLKKATDVLAITPPRSTAAARGKAVAKYLSPGLSFENVSRRLTSMLPTATKVEYGSAEATEQLRRFALTYMPKAQANLVAAMYSKGDVAVRRGIYKGVVEQLIHSSGMESSASGTKLAEAMRSDASVVDKQRYSTIGVDEMHDDAGVRRAGLYPAQMSTEMWLPSFAEMQKVAAKTGIWDHTMGAVLNHSATDAVLSTVRTGWLVTGSNAVRNVLDQNVAALARSMGPGALLKARGHLSKEIGRRIVERELPDAVENLAAKKASMNGIPYGESLKDAADATKDAGKLVRKLKVLSWFHRAAGIGFNAVSRAAPLKGLKRSELEQWASELGEVTGRPALEALSGIGAKAPQSVVSADGLDEAADIMAAGLPPKVVGFRLGGYESVSADGEAGARAWAHNLAQRFTPDGLGYGVLKMIHHGDSPEIRAVLADIIKHHPDLEDFRHQSEHMKFLHDKGITQAEADAAMEAHLDKLGMDMTSMLVGRHTWKTPKGGGEEAMQAGVIAKPLINYLIKKGEAPTIDWIERNIPDEMRPQHAIGRKWVAVPPARNKATGLAQGYSNFLTRAYKHVVSDPISFLSAHPIYAVNYAHARKNLQGYEKMLVDGGLTAERASELTQKVAHTHAWDRTVDIIDDPEVQSHFSVLGRNFVNFERAMEQFIRRWRDVIVEDPSRLRKAQLMYQGATHAGIIDHDEQGNPIFVYPGSGQIINAMLKMGSLLPGVPTVKIPTVPNLHSQVVFLNPSLDNPIQLSFSPVVGMPIRMLSNFFPSHDLGFSQLDQVMNGNAGAGRDWWEQFMPSPVNRFVKALNPSDRQSQVASAMRNSIVNLEAAGHMPIGPDASPDDVQKFLHQLQVQSRNQLFLRSIFAFFLPAAPSLPDETAGEGGNDADPIFQAQGIQSLKEEYRKLVNDLGYDKATQVWAKVHPDDLAYEVGTTDTPGSAFVPPTDSAMRFIQSNRPLFEKYPSIAAYFLPQAPEEFSSAAWNAELGMGLRQYKDVGTFYRDVVVVGAERIYYAKKKQDDDAIAKAVADGNTELATSLRQQHAQWSVEFNKLNPLFAVKQAGYGVDSTLRKQAIDELRALTKDGSLPQAAGDNAIATTKLINAYEKHRAFQDRLASRRDDDATADKQAEKASYQSYAENIARDYPEIRDLYNGLFRDGAPILRS